MGSTLALIALGSNLGDRRAILDRAIGDLAGSPGVVVRRVSLYSETPPVGGPGGQGAFLNAAAALETTLDPIALHRLLIEVEQKAGRVREVRWDARTLDLDLILFGHQIIDTPELVVPHPRFAVRRFVLAPLIEVAPDSVDPLTRRTISDLLRNLDRRPSSIALHESIRGEGDRSHFAFSSLVRELNAVGLADDGSSSQRLSRESEAIWGKNPRGLGHSSEWGELARLSHLGNELAEERWSEAIWGDRWVVTDRWLGWHWYEADFFAHEWDLERSRFRPDRSRTEHYREVLRSLQLRSIRPTFVLWLDDGSGAFRQWFERSRETQSMEFDAPILRVRSAAYREACEGERAAIGTPGLIDSWSEEEWARFAQDQCELEGQYLRDAVDEALAACAASRVGFGTT